MCTAPSSNILIFHCRYHAIPSFGRDTIWRFADNCLEMKKMAAHNFEDLLQVSEPCTCHDIYLALTTPAKCAIIVFDGLLPEPHNKSICELLFIMSHWHALAKLWMHNDLTLDVMDKVTILLGASLRHFKDVTASGFKTRELGKEYNARLRCKACKVCKAANTTSGTTPSFPIIPTDSTTAAVTSMSMLSASEANGPTEAVDPVSMPAKVSKKRVPFNMNTYKAHLFPDYVRTIRRFGTTDSYSTEPVSWTFYSVSDIFHIWFLS